MSNSPSRRFSFGLFFFFCCVPALVSLPFIQCLGDDTFIYMRMIERYLATRQFEYNPGEPCYAMTSVVWFLSWAFATKLTGDLDVARYVLSLLYHSLAVMSMLWLSKHLIRHSLVRLAVLTAVFLDPFYLRWFWAGWESSPKIALAALILASLMHEPRSAWSFAHAAAVGALAGVGILTRPEMVILALLGLLYVILISQPRKVLHAAAFLLGLLGVLLPWELYAWKTFGWLVPHTIFAKSNNVSIVYIKYALSRLLSIVVLPSLPVYGCAALATVWGLGAAGVRGILAPISHLNSGRFVKWLLVSIWGATIFGYVVNGSPIESIKTCLFSPFLILSAGAVIDRWGADQTWAKRCHFIMIAGTVALSFVIQSRLYYRFAFWHSNYREGEDREFIQFAREINALTPENARIGLSELGVIGYYSQRYIIDFVGLATPEIVSYKRRYGNDGIRRYLAEKSGWPEYIVAPIPSTELSSRDVPARTFYGAAYRRVHSRDVRRIGGGEPRGQFTRYILYQRVD